jgi:hypothetical protein
MICSLFVIPVQTGIQFFQEVLDTRPPTKNFEGKLRGYDGLSGKNLF